MKNNPVPLVEIQLEDGTPINIRPITLQDIEREKDFISGLSQQTKRDRFLGAVSELSTKQLVDLCNIDYLHEMAFVATVDHTSDEKIIGVVRYAEDASNHKSAEIAVTVGDNWQGHGVGTELLKRLIEFAQLAGIKSLYSIDSYSNEKMKTLANDFGFSKKTDPDDSNQVIYQLDISP